jgi:hypothetical protein
MILGVFLYFIFVGFWVVFAIRCFCVFFGFLLFFIYLLVVIVSLIDAYALYTFSFSFL